MHLRIRRMPVEFLRHTSCKHYPLPAPCNHTNTPRRTLASQFCTVISHAPSPWLFRRCRAQLPVFCFPGSSLNGFGCLPECRRLLWEQKPLLLGASGKSGRKRGNTKCRTYMLSGIAQRHPRECRRLRRLHYFRFARNPSGQARRSLP